MTKVILTMAAVVQAVSFSLRAQVRSQFGVRRIYDGLCSSWTRLFPSTYLSSYSTIPPTFLTHLFITDVVKSIEFHSATYSKHHDCCQIKGEEMNRG
jgi:hypothetical protein